MRRTLVIAALLGVATTAGVRGEVRVITAPGVPVLLPRPEHPPERIVVPPKPEPPPPPPVTRRFAPVTVEDAATLVAGQLRFMQPGVAPVPLDETCRDGAGVDWPCGRRALMWLRNFVRLRPIECELPKNAKHGRFEVACRIGGVEFGGEAVRRGWARAGSDGRFGALEDEARREGRGIFGAAPAVAPPIVETQGSAELPPDLTTAPLAGAGDAPMRSGPSAQTKTAPVPRAPMPFGQ